MSTLAGALLSFLLLYKYIALFLVTFVSAIILPLPTNTVFLAAGAFASQGYFNFWISLGVAVLANTMGDSTDFFLARRYGRPVLERMHVKIPPYIARLEAYVGRHPGPTIFITRFAGTTDIVANFLAGFAAVPFIVFLLWDVVGNIFSIGSVLYAGYFLGAHWQDVSGLFSIVGLILITLILIAALAIALWYRQRRHS